MNMHGINWVLLYFGGLLVGIISWICNKPETITIEGKYRKLVNVLVLIFWPVILPFSFAALFLNICYFFHWLAPYRYNPFSWVFKTSVRWLQRHNGGFWNSSGKQVIVE